MKGIYQGGFGMTGKTTFFKRALSIVLCLALLVSYVPVLAKAAEGDIFTVVDPETLTRPGTIYGDNTMNAGKVTVGKSVSNTSITVNGQTIPLTGDNNFLITISQSAQVMGLASQTSVPVDVVFVLDTSGSMEDNDRAETMVTAANSAIATLMKANEQNRVAVVAFSSEGDGGGTSNDAAANVLSSLTHYTGDAATNHLQWVTSRGSTTGDNRSYIAGRDISGTGFNQTYARRHGKNGGTNIQAGIIEGAKILTSVTNTTYTDPKTNESVTRIPFLIILSDGQPTYTYSDETWYDPTSTSEQGPGSGSYEGNGFIAAMTAAYYKGLITEHYYGEKANAENRCFVYTMGVEISSLTGDNLALAQITLDPKSQTTGANADSYWHYGNSFNDDTKNIYYGWKTYWENYLADPAADFDVRINSGGSDTYIWVGEGEPQEYYEVQRPREPSRWASDEDWEQYEKDLVAYNAWLEWRDANFLLVTGRTYTFTAESIAASRKYVSSIAYNDEYFSADSVSQMQAIFEAMVRTIQEKAISSPTKVTTGDHNFDGYINFYDPIGEYMEVKDMKGVLANGQFYEGSAFAQKLMNYGTANADADFDAMLRQVIKTRMGLSSADGRFENEEALDAFIDGLLSSARDSKNQAYYTDSNNFDNSIVWWGNAYDSGEEDEHVQMIGFADDDSIAYITDAATQIPEGADYVCRSYFFYSTGESAQEYMYFMVRIQRELVAPYRETVVISAPASLLSVEKVLINESYDDNGNVTYTATVEHKEPARVVYEVGLWDTITPENVSLLVSSDYTSEKVNGAGSVNYDPVTGTYHFFTNDWDRTESLDSHHRGMAKATFDAAADNPFYTYQKDTLVVDANGNPVTADPAGTTAYYVRVYYEWANDGKVDGTYTATKKTVLIEVEIPENTELLNVDGQWFIPAGTYTAATLVVNGDDTMKDDPATEIANDGNKTGTSSIVAHPHRTGSADNSHYTVFLGNNGKLSMVADPYEPGKTVSVNLPDGAVSIVDDEGKPVEVGDVLTYTVEVKNVLTETADITVTDYIPLGTAFVEGSAGTGTKETGHTKDASIKPDSNNVLTWVLTDVPAGETRYVSFQVTVTEAALSLNVVPGSLSNTAVVQINDLPAIHTGTTHSSVFGKSVTDVNNRDIDGDHGFKVGDTLVYHIRFHNNATDSNGSFVAADVTVTDKLPAGTTFLSADNGGSYDAATGTVTWRFENMAANTSKVVSFRVQINAGAKISESGTQPENGEIYLPNTATITVNNIPVITNTTQNWADVGDMVISKTVAAGGDQSKTFTILLGETSGLLDGTYVMLRGAAAETVVFTDGRASVTIKHGETLTIKGLPAGAIISVAEDVSALPGWAPTYNTQSITILKGAATTVSSVSVTNTYTLQPLTLTLKGEKNVDGDLPNETTFGFVAVPDSGNPVVGDPLTGEVTVQASGKYEFTMSSKIFTKPGVYKYTISEIDGGVEGVTYDPTDHVLVINVIDNGDGTMRAEATLGGTAFDMNNDAVSFTNSYVPYIPSDAVVQLEATKNLTGRAMEDKEFSFVVRKDNENGAIVAVGSNDASGRILFSTFDITAADMNGETSKTFTYVVVESNNNIPGVSVDSTVFTVTVTVTDDGSGTLKAMVNYPDGKPIVFNNTYTPRSAKLPLVAFKSLTGKNLLANEFTFELKDASGQIVQSVKNDANGVITFNDLVFTAEDMVDENGSKVMTKTFVYTLTEKTGDVDGMTYDENVYTITVTVTDDGKGSLSATAVCTDINGAVELIHFTNSYTPASVKPELDGSKIIIDADGNILTGENYDLAGFEFEVFDAEGNLITTATSDAQGNIKFTGFEFTQAGEYRFLISEKTTDRAGYSTDTTVWCAHITIAYNADTGVLYEADKYIHKAMEAHDEAMLLSDETVRFVNVYDPADVSLTLKLKKELDGRQLRDHEFTFYMVDDATGLRVAEARNHANGDINLRLTYTTTGTYSYTIFEFIPAEGDRAGGVEYSTEAYQLTVTVTDDGTGALKAEVGTITVLGEGTIDMTGTIIFHNKYESDTVDVVVEATKTLAGKALWDQEFTFQLINVNDSAEKYTATNTANGKIVFDQITFTEAGVYVYELSEVEGTADYVTYDGQKYTVTVTVTDDGNGKLHAVTRYTSSSGTEADPVFHNVYTPASVDYFPEVTKIFEGADMRTFTFILSGEGFETQTKQNDADGKVLFDKLTFTKAGTYTFTITEQADPDMDDVKWDENVYTVTVTVDDAGLGVLEISDVTVTSELGRTDLIFRNIHEDLITDKDVVLNGDPTISIDGENVKVGDVLTYTIFYTNYTGKNADVTIIDTIPAYTTYVDASVSSDGVFADGVITWELKDIAPGETVSVSFSVTVSQDNVQVENQATVLEGENTYTTNTVSNPVPVPEIPNTGDNAPLGVWFALLAVSGCGLISTAVCGKKKEEEI